MMALVSDQVRRSNESLECKVERRELVASTGSSFAARFGHTQKVVVGCHRRVHSLQGHHIWQGSRHQGLALVRVRPLPWHTQS